MRTTILFTSLFLIVRVFVLFRSRLPHEDRKIDDMGKKVGSYFKVRVRDAKGFWLP